jgi:tetratricopeptide (TPR) repeat protein
MRSSKFNRGICLKSFLFLIVIVIVIVVLIYEISQYFFKKIKSSQISHQQPTFTPENTVLPDSSRDLYRQGIDKLNNQDYEAAIYYFHKALEINQTRPEYYFNLAHAYYYSSYFSKAKDYYLKTLQFNKYNAMVYYNLGIVELNQNNKSGALEYFLKTLEIKGGIIDAYYYVAFIYYKQGFYLKAISYLKGFLKYSQTNKKVYNLLIMCLIAHKFEF